MTAVPFTAFCPECKAHRTFTVIGNVFPSGRVGCCVCGTSEREALVALSARLSDDRDTIAEMAARLNTLDGEVAELRDELHTYIGRAAVIHRGIYDRCVPVRKGTA